MPVIFLNIFSSKKRRKLLTISCNQITPLPSVCPAWCFHMLFKQTEAVVLQTYHCINLCTLSLQIAWPHRGNVLSVKVTAQHRRAYPPTTPFYSTKRLLLTILRTLHITMSWGDPPNWQWHLTTDRQPITNHQIISLWRGGGGYMCIIIIRDGSFNFLDGVGKGVDNLFPSVFTVYMCNTFVT